MKQMTFDEWYALHRDEFQSVECVNCAGTGEDTCPHCGSDIDCDECGGRGKVGGLNDAIKAYKAIAAKEAALVARMAVTP